MNKLGILINKNPCRIPVIYKRSVIFPHKEIKYSRTFLGPLKNSIYHVERQLYVETIEWNILEDDFGNLQYMPKAKPKSRPKVAK
jgi:hypothetical protein